MTISMKWSICHLLKVFPRVLSIILSPFNCLYLNISRFMVKFQQSACWINNSVGNILRFFFFYFSRRKGFDIACKLSPKQDYGWVLTLNMTDKNFSRPHFDFFSLIFPRKSGLVLHAKCLFRKNFACNTKPYLANSIFLANIRKTSVCCVLN